MNFCTREYERRAVAALKSRAPISVFAITQMFTLSRLIVFLRPVGHAKNPFEAAARIIFHSLISSRLLLYGSSIRNIFPRFGSPFPSDYLIYFVFLDLSGSREEERKKRHTHNWTVPLPRSSIIMTKCSACGGMSF